MINRLKLKSPFFYPLILFLIFSITNTHNSPASTNDIDFKWRAIPFPYDIKKSQAMMFDSLNGWTFCQESQQLYQYKNGEWHIVSKPADIHYYNVFGFSKNNVWVGCFDKKIYRHFLWHHDGKKLKKIYPPNSDGIRDLDFISPDNIWGACEWGEIIHYDGKDWNLIPSPVFAHLETVNMINDSLGYFTGEYRGGSNFLLWNGRYLSQKTNIDAYKLKKVIMVNPTIGWLSVNNEKNEGFIFKNDNLEKLDYSTLVQDTLIILDHYGQQTLFYYPNRTVIQKGHTAYTSTQNGKREILEFPVSHNFEEFYWFASDGSVRLVKCKPVDIQNQTNLYEGPGDEGLSEYGTAFFDADKDGDEDIYIINTDRENRLKLYGGNQEIKTKLPHHFVDGADVLNVLGTNKTKIGDYVFDMGVSVADVENDGDRDVYITCLYGKNQLHTNLKGKKFKEIAAKAKVTCGETRSNVGIWGDVNNDGNIDLFVTNEDTTNMLFLNDDAGQFNEITHQAGLTSNRSGKGATFGDLDLDGNLDLVVPYFSLRNRVYQNNGINNKTGLPVFTDVTDLWLPPGPDSLAKSASATLADFDDDGDLDLFIANLIFSNRLYENDGAGQFTDITAEIGLLDSSLSHHGCFFDADNDGDLDLYVTNRGKNIFFENLNGEKFVRNSKIINMDQVAYSTGFACGDPDSDGDIDCYLCNNDQSSLYLRNLINNNSFVRIKMIGTKSNRDAIGAKTFLYEAGHLNEKDYCLGLREINGGYGYGCQNSLIAHYGVDPEKTYDLKVLFPSGIKIIQRNINPGQTLIIEEQEGWAKLNSRITKYILRTVKRRKNQHKLIFLLTYIFVLFIIATLIKIKKGVNPHFIKYMVGIPIVFYVFISAFLYEQEFILSELLPTSILLLSFIVTFFTLKKRTTSVTTERIVEELLSITNVFDHGSWAMSYLNQFQLFAANLSNKKTISIKVEHQLFETITGFYEQVYYTVKKIYELAQEANIEANHAAELYRQLLFLSDNLNKVKVNLNIKKRIPAEVWKNIFRLVDGIKINIKAIKFSTFKYFTCDPIVILERNVSQFKEKVNYPVVLHSKAEKKCQVCLKPSDLSAIMDNLLSNANRAMANSVDKRIEIRTRSTDQYFEIECSDIGTGIPKNLWEKIFDVNYSTKPGKENGGFGLYYSKSVLEKFGGSIEVLKSSKNKGTTFLVKLRLL